LEIDINGLKINYHDNSTDIGVIKEIFLEDPYYIMGIPNGSLVIDIGAHIGIFSLRCAKEKNCTVYSYEPCEDNYRLLINNICNNGLGDKIKAFRNAVSNKSEIREFYVDPYHYAGSSFYLKYFADKKAFDRPYNTEKVECITLKQIFDDNGIAHCNILKMDCEYEEKNILLDKDSSDILENIDKIILEFHCLSYGKEIAEHLKNKRFSLYCNNKFQFERGTIYANRDYANRDYTNRDVRGDKI